MSQKKFLGRKKMFWAQFWRKKWILCIFFQLEYDSCTNNICKTTSLLFIWTMVGLPKVFLSYQKIHCFFLPQFSHCVFYPNWLYTGYGPCILRACKKISRWLTQNWKSYSKISENIFRIKKNFLGEFPYDVIIFSQLFCHSWIEDI